MSDESLTAGRELDALVAEKLFGIRQSLWSLHIVHSRAEVEGREWRPGVGTAYAFANDAFPTEVLLPDGDGDMPCLEAYNELGEWVEIPHYSTDISAAWEVAEAMRARGLKFDLNDRNGEPGKEYWAEFAAEDYDTGAQAWEASMPLAICKAALAAIEART